MLKNKAFNVFFFFIEHTAQWEILLPKSDAIFYPSRSVQIDNYIHLMNYRGEQTYRQFTGVAVWHVVFFSLSRLSRLSYVK